MGSEIGKKRKTDQECDHDKVALDQELQQLRLWKEKQRSDYEKRGKILREVVLHLAKAERTVARNTLLQNSSRYGHYAMRSVGTGIYEYWEEAQEWKDINERLEPRLQAYQKVAEKKSNLMAQIEMQRRSANVGGSVTEAESSAQSQKLVLEYAMLQFQEASIRRDIENIQYQNYVHEQQKTIYKHEAKRIRQEDASPFREFPEYQNRYMLLNFLGKGGFGEVYKAFDVEENKYVACKLHLLGPQISNNEQQKLNILHHLNREWNVHETLVHSHIIRHFDNFRIDEGTFCTVLELCNGKDLQYVLKTVRAFAESDAKTLISQILNGLAYLNEREERVIHYDLKPANILLADGVAKISDFGLCKVMEVGSEGLELTSPGAGTIWYLPSECLVEGANRQISTKVDVWSAGVVFYELLFGRVPFGFGPGKSREAIRKEIIGNVLQFPSTPEISPGVKAFIQRCLTSDQALRPSAGTLAQDPYLRPSEQNV